MTQFIADTRDVAFNLHELFTVEHLFRHERFSGITRDACDLILAEAREFALREMLAVYQDGDEQGVRFDNGRVTVPESFRRVFRRYCDNQWNAPASGREFGGQGLPSLVAGAVREYMMGANWPIYAYGSMGVGTGRMIESFGSEDQKRTYVRNLYTGRWGGTMLHTEPEAGTDVGALTTTATRNPDGTFLLVGAKIYITNGEHDLCDNIIHPVLARVQGDPPGTRGLSIFIVPKYRIRPDGSPGEANDIVCTGIEEKHGLRGSATCSMLLGSRGACVGHLLGRRREGMAIMFTMMNQARLNVGIQALAYASSAYLHALDHARSRIQGRDPGSRFDPGAPPVPIIRHPDVKRNLMEMKAVTEGLRSLIYFTMDCVDRAAVAEDRQERERLEGLVELLTPVIKGFGCEQGYGVCIRAIQVFGGAGYIRGYPVESIARDCKITTLYEGCTGIQALDLVSRKLSMRQGRILGALFDGIEAVIRKAGEHRALRDPGLRLGILADRLKELSAGLCRQISSGNPGNALAQATPFMEVMGEVCLGWMLLRRAVTAAAALDGSSLESADTDFYQGQIRTARFFFQTHLPVIQGRMEALGDNPSVITEIMESDFGAA
jgi:alkylation response protein AidB-like acyl-CoA dehydrogenase